jgi:hypothetical protein
MRRLTLILPAMLLALSLTLGPAGPAAAAPTLMSTGTPGNEVGPVSCWSAGNCIVTVSGNTKTTAAILLIHHGHVAGREPVVSQDTDGYVAFDGASCPTASTCFLSGLIASNTTGGSVGFIASVAHGRLGRELAFSQMDDVGAISCAPDGACLAVGGRERPNATARQSTGFLIALADGLVQRVSGLGAIDPAAISCVAGSCLVVGDHPFSPVGASVGLDRGVPGRVTSLPFSPSTVACTSATRCLVAGGYLDTVTDADTDYVDTVQNGRYATPRAIPNYVNQLACTSATTCVATAADNGAGGSGQAGLVTFTRGVPSPLHPVAGVGTLEYVACAGGACLADGTSTPGHRGIVYAF